jgi:hypothetical protein
VSDPITIALAFGVVGATIGGSVLVYKLRRERFVREANELGDVVVLDGRWTIGLATKDSEPLAQAVAAGGGKNNPTRWDVTSMARRMGVRTTLHIDREGVFGALRETFGKHDVHTGDDAFDKQFCLRGGDADIVRGVFQEASVQHAVRVLFEQRAVRYVKLNADGGLYAWVGRAGLNAYDARLHAQALQKVARALEAHADRAPVPSPTSPLRTSGVGGASGAPVGVPIGDRRERG